MRTLSACFALIIVSGCGSECPKVKVPEPVKVEITDVGCIESLGPPPIPEALAAEMVAGSTDEHPTDCPSHFELCQAPEPAAALDRWLRRVLSWQAQAWANCSKPEVTK